jgi:hypothetical protein
VVRTNTEPYVVAALASCLRRYPGRALSLHSDNGSESMPGHLTRFCHGRDITFTRSRPYQGNDNPHVEEKGAPSSTRSWDTTGMTARKRSTS